MRFFAVPLLAAAALAGCGLPFGIGDGIPGDIPDWLYDEISAARAAPVANPPASFWSYRYRGDVAYYRPAECCDAFALLRDRRGVGICSPDGGITGQGDGRCPDFMATRTEERLIWRDGRTYPSR